MKEINYLKQKDPKLSKIIDKYGNVKREIEKDLYKSLISSIISQQISTKAADSIKAKLIKEVGKITPNNIIKLNKEDLRLLGISFRKGEYILLITKHFINNPNYQKYLESLSEDEIINELVKFKGIGIWTAEMTLIHCFNNMNIISFNDLGIKRGIMRLHNLEEITKEDEIYFKKLYHPYATIASIYLWEHSK